jgi:hypothetical protein
MGEGVGGGVGGVGEGQGELLRVVGDPTRLSQVVRNLLSNSLKVCMYACMCMYVYVCVYVHLSVLLLHLAQLNAQSHLTPL